MALFRKFFYRKPPDGLLEISERVYVFDCCFTTDILEDEEYKVYMGGIVGQLRDHLPDASFMVFNFREGENQSQIDNILSEYDMTVIDYPRQYEGCPLLTMEMIHHFLKSSESWLSLGQQNVLLMHCERGGWPVLAFMLAALLIFRKQFTGEQKTLDMIYKQAPRELLQLMCPLNPLPSQLRYLQYVSRRNVGSGWPPLDRALTLDCIILRLIPSLDGEGGCRPIFRIYGQDPLMVADRTPKVLFSTPKRSKFVRHYKQADCALVKIDIHCHIQGDVVLECISLDSDQEREEMMFRVMFNTAFIRSNILMLNRDDIDILWNSKDQFPKDFRAEVLFSEMDATTSFASIDLPGMEEKDGLPVEAFARVQEIFSNVDWLDPRSDVALNVLQHITASNRPQENLEMSSPDTAGTGNNMVASALAKFEEKPKPKAAVNNIKIPTFTIQGKQPTPLFIPSPKENEIQKNNEPQESQVALQRPAQSKIISQRSSFSSPVSFNNSLQGSPMPITRYHSAPSLLGITALLHDHDVSNNEDTLHQVTRSPPTPVTASPSVTSLQKPLQLNHTVSTPLPLPPSLPPSLQSLVEAHKTVKRISVSPTPPPLPPKSSLKLIQSSVTQLTATTSDGGELSLSALSPTPPVPSTSEVFTSSSALQSSIDSHITTQITHITPLPQHTLAPTESLLARPLETISLARDQSLSTSSPPPQLLSPSEASTVSTKRLHSSTPPPPPPPPRFDAPPFAMVDNLLSTPPPLMATSSPSSNNLFSSPPLPPPPPPFSGSSPSSAPCSLSSMPTKSSVVSLEPPPPHLPSRSPNNMSSVPPPPPSLPRCGPPLPPLPPLKFGGSSCISSAPPPPPPPPPSMPTPGPPPPPPPPNMPTPGPPPPPPPTMAKPGPPPPPPPPLNSRSSVNTSLAPPPPPPPCLAPKNNLGSNSSHAPPVPPPPAPFAKGLSSSKDGGASLPSQSGRSNGSIPPIPGPPSGSPFSARGSGLSRTRNQSLPKKTNLKPYHWLKLTRAMQGSLWAETQKPEEASKAPEFDMSELESLFSAAAPNSDHGGKDGKSSRRSAGPKVEKVQLIELRRAYNCEIMLSKIKIPLPDLMSLVLALDDSALDVDQVDNLIKFCPTKEEIETLKGYKGDKEKLGKCELFFLELMKVPRVESKLRVFSFKMQFHSQVSDLRKNLNIVNSASEEVRNSVKLKRIMQTILSLGNALNHGTARGSAVGFRLDSLLKLTDTRARNNKMTLMHYLCKVLAEKLPELLDFPQDLASLEAATKIQLKYLAEEMQAISKGLEKVVQELTASENDGPISEYFCKTLKEFLAFAEGEVRSLALLYSNVGRNADALALYFGEDPARCPFEQVVSTLLNFVRMFVRAHQENCKQVELEKKKALKEAENEKLKTAASERNTNSISIK